jgi:hypothetical protein
MTCAWRENNKAYVPCTSLLVAHTNNDFVYNKIVLFGECVVNRLQFLYCGFQVTFQSRK